MTTAKNILLYFPVLDARQMQQFDKLAAMYIDWNQKINLISRKDMDHLYERHILHSLGIAKIVVFQPGAKVLDLGTGGGLPGIPLAILFPGTRFHLVDSVGKKINAVQAIAEELALENVTTAHQRAEKIKGKYDFIVCRAVAPLRQLYLWTKDKIADTSRHAIPNGLICLKGGDLEEEIKELRRPCYEYALSNYFKEEFFVTKKVVHVPI